MKSTRTKVTRTSKGVYFAVNIEITAIRTRDLLSLRPDKDLEGEIGSCDSECAETPEDLTEIRTKSVQVTTEHRD